MRTILNGSSKTQLVSYTEKLQIGNRQRFTHFVCINLSELTMYTIYRQRSDVHKMESK